MSEHSKLVAQLQKELSLEHDSRRRQQELNAKLQHEYDVLLKKLAEAELHIDKLRLGANVELNKWYVLRYATEQNSTLRQRLEAEFDPSSRAADTGYQIPSPHEEPHTEQRIEAETIVNIGDGGVRSNASVSGNANDSHTFSDTSLLVSQCSESNVSISPQPLENGLDTNVLSGLHNGLLEQANTGVDGSCSQLSLLHLSSHSSSAHLSSHATDSDELCISQMSAGTIATCGSAESMLLAHLLQLHSLQEQLTALKLKINEGGASLDEILSDLSHIQDGHRQLSSDIDISSGHLDRLREKYNGKDFDHIARSREAVGKELANLSTQLQELGGLIRTKTPELSQKNDVPPSSSATESVLLSHTGKQGTDSDSHMSTFFDSLNSPALPTKYLSQDVIASPIKEEPLMTGLPPSIPQSVAGTQSSIKTDPLSSVSREHFMNAKSHSTISGTPLEELLDVGVAGCGLNVESCEDTLSNLSDILPSDTRSENSQDEVLKEAKQNLERAEMFRLENRYPTQSQVHVQPSTPSHASHFTSAASPLTNVNDQYQSSNNPLLVRHSTPASHYQAPPINHTPLTAHSQQNDPNNPLSPFTHRHTLPSPFPRPQTTDSGFAGSEFPSRAGKINVLNTVDSPQKKGQDSIPYQQLVEESSKEESVSLLTEADKELSVNSVEVPKEDEQQEKRPSLTVAAIDSLRNELASLKEQIMQTVQQQNDYASLKLESHSRSPLIHSHSSLRGEQRRPSTTSSSNTTATPSHNYNTEHKVPARSTTIPQTMPGLVTDPLNHDTCSNESYTSHSPSSVPHTDDRRSLNSTPKRHYTSRPSSMVSFTPSTRYQDTHTQYVSTPTKTVTPFGTPLPTPHILGLNSHKRDRPSSGEPPQEWISDGGSPFIAGQTCPRCGEQSVQVSSREKTSEDGSKRHRYVTYVHSCRSNVGGTPLRDSGGLRNSNALINSSGESNTVVGKSVMPGRDSEYETHHNGVSIEDGRIPTATSRLRGSISRSVFTETAAKGRQRAAASRSEGEIGGLYDNENHHWEETTFRNITPKCRTTHTEAARRPSYTAYTTRRETNSSSTNSSPTYMYKSSPERSSSSVHTSPHHTHPTELYRRGSTPAAFATSTASYTGPSHVHHARLYHTPTSKQQVKVHRYPLSSGSNRYKVRYAPSERRDQQHPQVIHTSSARKPSTRNSIPENSPEYHPYTSQLRTTSQRSKSRRKVVRLIPAIPSDEVCYSEPGVKIRNKRQRKRRHFVDHGDSVRGVYVKPRQVYVVEGEECSSDSERDVEVDGMELEEIMELARGLKRRSCRMQTSLQAALNKRGVY